MNEDEWTNEPYVLADTELESVSGGLHAFLPIDSSSRLEAAQRLRQQTQLARQRLQELRQAPIGLGCPRGHQRDSQRGKKGGSALRAQLQKDQQLLNAALRMR